MIHQRLITKGLKYYLTFPHFRGLGISSSWLFRMVNEVFVKDIDKEVLRKIENYRQSILKDKGYLQTGGLGAIPLHAPNQRRVSSVIGREAVSDRYGKLLFRLVSENKPEVVLELGTSLGISALWMALANTDTRIITMEGSSQKAALVKQKMDENYINNVEIVIGNFDDRLAGLLKEIPAPGFVFIDGNHRKEPTCRYFNEILKYCSGGAVFVLDDICWSPEMMEAWKEIRQHPRSRLCLDLFRFGIIFVDPKLSKQHFTIFY